MVEALIAVVGVVIGAVLGWYLAQSGGKEQKQLLAERKRQIEELERGLNSTRETHEGELKQLRNLLDAEKAAKLGAEGEIAKLTGLREQEREHFQERLAELEKAEARLKDSFKALATETLDESRKSFLDLAKEQLASFQEQAKGDLEKRQQAVEGLVKPINEKLDKFDKAVRDIEIKRETSYTKLSEQLSQLREAERELTGTAQDLTTALRGKATRWGSWGEMQLKRVVELAGMLDHVDFAEQQVLPGTHDRPDLVVYLPGSQRIVVDAKAVTEAYMPVVEAADDAERTVRLKEYAGKVKKRLTELGSKSYWDQLEGSPEFVVMFLPGEGFFSAALEGDPALIETGVQHKVILATPTTLIALLRAVAYGWRQEQLHKNAQEISELARELHDRIRVWTGHMRDLGTHMERATGAYNKAVGSLEARVLPQARKFEELGAGSKEPLPELSQVEGQPKGLLPPD